MPLADSFFLLVHDESGRARLHSRATAYGLAAALLLELAVSGHVTTRERMLVARASQHIPRSIEDRAAAMGDGGRVSPPTTPLLHHIWDQVQHEQRPLDVRSWLAALAPSIIDAVAARLILVGFVRVQEVGLVRKTTRYVASERLAGAKISAMLAGKLMSRAQLEWEDVLLAGLVNATGMLDDLLATDHLDTGRRYLTEVFREVRQQRPDILTLLTETEAAIGDAVIAHRN